MIVLKNKSKIFLFFFLLILLVICYFYLIKPKFSNVSPIVLAKEIDINFLEIESSNVETFIENPARVSSTKIAEIRPQVEGIITKINFEEGSFVKKGKQLYQIDDTIYKASYDAALFQFKAISQKYGRYKKLLKIDAISKQEYDDIYAEYIKAKSNLKTTKQMLNYTKVYSPISGYIGRSNVTEGALALTNQTQILTTITQLDPIYVDITCPSKDVFKIRSKKNSKVSISLDGVEYEVVGSLKSSEVFVDESTDSVRIRAKFSNKNHRLLPGMFVNSKIYLDPIKAVLVPQKSTMRDRDGNLNVFLIVKNEDKYEAKQQKITAEKSINGNWIVLDGLSDGDIIAYDGIIKITNKAKVNPVEKIELSNRKTL